MSTNFERLIKATLERDAAHAPPVSELRIQGSPSTSRLNRPPRTWSSGWRSTPVLVGLVAATVVALVAGGVLARSLVSDNEAPAVAGEGAQLPGIAESVELGRGAAVVSVPAGWGRGQVQCGQATADTVIFPVPAMRACQSPPSTFDSVSIVSARKAVLPPDEREVQGVAVYSTPPTTEAGMTVIELVVPSEDARFAIRTADPALTEAIAESLRILPEDKTTVPELESGASGGSPGVWDLPRPEEVEARLQAAGLKVQTAFEDGATGSSWSSVRASIRPGTVVDRGETVTVVFAGSPDPKS